MWSHRSVVHSEDYTKPTTFLKGRPDHNTVSSMPYFLQIVWGFFYFPQNWEHSRVVRRGLRFIVLIREDLKVLTICKCNYKGSTFSSVILRPWALVRLESNSRSPAGQTVAQPTEPPLRREQEWFSNNLTEGRLCICTNVLFVCPMLQEPPW